MNERVSEWERDGNTIALIINHFMKALMTCLNTNISVPLVIDLFQAFNCRIIDLLQIVMYFAILEHKWMNEWMTGERDIGMEFRNFVLLWNSSLNLKLSEIACSQSKINCWSHNPPQSYHFTAVSVVCTTEYLLGSF